jgi:hypothetical protein
VADSPWKALDTAPRPDADGKPVSVLLFVPGAWSKSDETGRPIAVAHSRVVGWWDEKMQSWVMGIHPNGAFIQKVYPSLWTELVADPELPA